MTPILRTKTAVLTIEEVVAIARELTDHGSVLLQWPTAPAGFGDAPPAAAIQSAVDAQRLRHF